MKCGKSRFPHAKGVFFLPIFSSIKKAAISPMPPPIEALDEDSEERIARLHAALEKLTPEERAIITFFYEEEKGIDEIAHILEQIVSNVKVKLHRIRKKLYVLINQEE